VIGWQESGTEPGEARPSRRGRLRAATIEEIIHTDVIGGRSYNGTASGDSGAEDR
jgi:hypothetical protein